MTDVERYGNPATRVQILDAVWQLVEARGTAVTMAEAARAAGVSRQAVYLHFTNRSGLLVALVEHIDRELGLAHEMRSVRAAATGREQLERMIALHATYTGRIIGVARLLDTTRHDDPDVAAAWEDRMAGRREEHRRIIRAIAEDGDLAEGWDIESAALLLHGLTLPRLWDEFVIERGWSEDRYRSEVTRMLSRALLVAE